MKGYIQVLGDAGEGDHGSSRWTEVSVFPGSASAPKQQRKLSLPFSGAAAGEMSRALSAFPHQALHLPFVCRKTSKNNFNHRNEKIQMQRKTVKQHQIIIV